MNTVTYLLSKVNSQMVTVKPSLPLHKAFAGGHPENPIYRQKTSAPTHLTDLFAIIKCGAFANAWLGFSQMHEMTSKLIKEPMQNFVFEAIS